MHIKSVRIRNYRSFFDSRELSFSPGVNLVVGANNVGKSSLLLCLAVKFLGEPHKSIESVPSRDEPLRPVTRVDYALTTTGDEIRKLLLQSGDGPKYLPWPTDTVVDQHNMRSIYQRYTASEVAFHASATAKTNDSPSWLANELVTRLGEPTRQNEHFRMLRVDVRVNDRTITPVDVPGVQPHQDFGHFVAAVFQGAVYRFSAERLNVSTSAHGTNAELASDARNLPEVLNILQSNPERFREYAELVSDVFPSVKKVSVRPAASGAGNVEILVWQVDPALQRDDLAIPLARCGTGLGQALAMLYVAKTSDQARTIIIDEPGSFLHPGASRALIRILQQFPQHQYIVATHSPEIISELSNAPVTIVSWENSKSALQQFPHTTGRVASAALAEVGARLSDVFGFDNVLWVEGQSDAATLKVLLDLLQKPQRRTAILPVRDTGAFRRRRIAEVIEIYRTLAMGHALLPPAALFLFDREDRTAREIEDLEREGEGKIRFLDRRMIENYLLNVEAISRVFNEVGRDNDLPPKSPEEVRCWIKLNGARFVTGTACAPLDAEWVKRVDAAKLLNALFDDLSENRMTYRKATHTPRLAEVLFQIDRSATEAIVQIVSDVFD